MFLYQAVLFSAAFHLMTPHTFDFYRVGVKCAETQTEVVLSIEYQDVPLISILTTRQNTLNLVGIGVSQLTLISKDFPVEITIHNSQETLRFLISHQCKKIPLTEARGIHQKEG